jgi:cell wall-associated NlpC family hydrolase
MRGSHADHSIRKYLATVAVAAVALSLLATPARAHTRDDVFRQRAHIENRVRSQIGEPWVSGGESPGGFDCSGLTYWTYRKHGETLPRSSIDQFYLGKEEGYKRIWKRSRLKEGDLVFHKTTSARVGHVGIYIGNDKFISTTSSEGVQVRSLYDKYYWGPRWVGATRVPANINN